MRFRDGSLDRRVSRISLLAIGVASAAGFILVVADGDPHKVIGIVTRSDLLAAHRRRLADAMLENPLYVLKAPRFRSRSSPPPAPEAD